MKALTGPPVQHSWPHYIKLRATTLQECQQYRGAGGLGPGHAGNGAALEEASALKRLRSLDRDLLVPNAPHLPDNTKIRAQFKQKSRVTHPLKHAAKQPSLTSWSPTRSTNPRTAGANWGSLHCDVLEKMEALSEARI